MRRHMLSMCICLFVVVVVLMLTSQHQSDWINVDVISPSGRHLVYTCSETDEQNDQTDDRTTNLCTVDIRCEPINI